MAAYSIDGGMDTARMPAADEIDQRLSEERIAAARNVISGIAADLHPGARVSDPDNPSRALLAAADWRSEMYDVLGLNGEVSAPKPVQAAPAPVRQQGEGRVVVKIRRGSADDDWRNSGACRDEDPELYFPIGTSGPAVLQAEQAKAVCRRCPVTDECLRWALESGQDSGVWGGMTEEERRAVKRRGGLRVMQS